MIKIWNQSERTIHVTKILIFIKLFFLLFDKKNCPHRKKTQNVKLKTKKTLHLGQYLVWVRSYCGVNFEIQNKLHCIFKEFHCLSFVHWRWRAHSHKFGLCFSVGVSLRWGAGLRQDWRVLCDCTENNPRKRSLI